MKRFSYCLIILLLLFTFASACGKTSGDADKTSKEAAKTSEEAAETTEAETTADEGPRAVMPVLTIPSRNVPDTESLRFVRSLGVGFNAGNTFDAYVDDKKLGDDTVTETAWVPDKLTKETIQAYHKAGFDSIRIPVSWHNHVSEDYTISEKWMARVKEAVDWALDDGMKVIINIHHDNHPEANAYYPDSAHLEQSKTYVRRIWEQVAETFSGYDERLIFEGLNEPRLVGTEYEWYVAQGVDVAEDSLACINELNQVFVDTVRAAGKMNAARYLMVPGYAGSPDGVLSKSFKIPDDPTDPTGESHRIILEVHAYTPYDFALKPDGGWYFDSSKSACTKDIDWFMDRLYNTYVVKGVPVIIDEFGAVSRLNKDGALNIQDRVDYSAYYVAAARSRGMSCFVWDNSAVEGDGELFGLYNRKWQYFVFPEIVDALVTYGK
ncbi:MAG: glycoside hydrolase family 5 protein [Lachnospiraceae bacterium]|nr:glycoside hydrolase family 5 protein [Lachnospiraceae bacterium]